MVPGTAMVEELNSTGIMLLRDISQTNPDGIGLVVHQDESGQREPDLVMETDASMLGWGVSAMVPGLADCGHKWSAATT